MKISQLRTDDDVIIDGWGALTVGELLDNQHLLRASPLLYRAKFEGHVRLSALDALFNHIENVVTDHALAPEWVLIVGDEAVTPEDIDDIQVVLDRIMARSPEVFQSWSRAEQVDYSELLAE